MFVEVSGDVLMSEAKAICLSVAPNDHFDRGLALDLRERWPAMVKDFRHFCREKGAQPGEVWVWAAPTGQRIISLLCQEPAQHEGGHPGKATLENVRHALHALKKVIEKEQIASVAIPRIATGVGGLAWADVRAVMSETFGPLPVPVYAYATFHPGVKATEMATKK